MSVNKILIFGVLYLTGLNIFPTPFTARAMTEKLPEFATLQFFGDVMLDRSVSLRMGKGGIEKVLSKNEMKKMVSPNVEMVSINLEGPFATARATTSKSIAFRFDPKLARDLKTLGISAANLANNHTYDMGARNVKFTRALLEKSGIIWFGDELSENIQSVKYFTASSGLKFALVGLNATYRWPDEKKLAKVLLEAEKQANFTIVNIHWGQEYRSTSTLRQQKFARFLVENGVDAIVGHHPHVIEEIEIYRGVPIFYSLGNFIFDQYFSSSTQRGLSVTLTFDKIGVKKIELIPHQSVRSVVSIMNSTSSQAMMNWLTKNSRLDGKVIENNTINF